MGEWRSVCNTATSFRNFAVVFPPACTGTFAASHRGFDPTKMNRSSSGGQTRTGDRKYNAGASLASVPAPSAALRSLERRTAPIGRSATVPTPSPSATRYRLAVGSSPRRRLASRAAPQIHKKQKLAVADKLAAATSPRRGPSRSPRDSNHAVPCVANTSACHVEHLKEQSPGHFGRAPCIQGRDGVAEWLTRVPTH